MVITYHGDNFFRVQSGNTAILVDPTNSRQKGTLSLKTLSQPDLAGQNDDIIDFAGEFNISDLDITGIQIIEESSDKFIKTIFYVQGLEDINICFLGHLSSLPTSEILEKLGRIDILFLPVGDNPYLSLADAQKIIKQLNPKIIIPAIHNQKDISQLVIKELGKSGSIESKLTLKSKDIPEKGPVVTILKND